LVRTAACSKKPALQYRRVFEIHGTIDPALVETALRRVVAEAEVLHITFVDDSEIPQQILNTLVDWSFTIIDVSEKADPHAAAEAWMQADLARPADLIRGPYLPLRCSKPRPTASSGIIATITLSWMAGACG